MNPMHKSFSRLSTGIFFTVVSSLSIASGSGGYGGGFGSGPNPSRTVDEVYEYGKSVYKGRVEASQGVDFCIANGDGNAEKVSRRSLKAHKNANANDLARVLVNCDQPTTSALTFLSPGQTKSLVYYLNKRYRLRLR